MLRFIWWPETRQETPAASPLWDPLSGKAVALQVRQQTPPAINSNAQPGCCCPWGCVTALLAAAGTRQEPPGTAPAAQPSCAQDKGGFGALHPNWGMTAHRNFPHFPKASKTQRYWQQHHAAQFCCYGDQGLLSKSKSSKNPDMILLSSSGHAASELLLTKSHSYSHRFLCNPETPRAGSATQDTGCVTHSQRGPGHLLVPPACPQSQGTAMPQTGHPQRGQWLFGHGHTRAISLLFSPLKHSQDIYCSLEGGGWSKHEVQLHRNAGKAQACLESSWERCQSQLSSQGTALE